jgi:outer membrane protein OmpA-like peptidoglycan-associated protein
MRDLRFQSVLLTSTIVTLFGCATSKPVLEPEVIVPTAMDPVIEIPFFFGKTITVSIEEKPEIVFPEPAIESYGSPALEDNPYQKAVKPIAEVTEKERASLQVTIESIVRDDFPNKVQAYVYVRDQDGNFIEGLVGRKGKDKLPNSIWTVVQEQVEGKPCDPKNVVIEEFGEHSSPSRSIVFVADYSGSMYDNIGYVESDIPDSIGELRFSGEIQDDWGLSKFDHSVERTIPLGQKGAIEEGVLNGLGNFGGSTALRDGILSGILELSENSQGKEKIVVVFTDGHENSSRSDSWDKVISDANQSKVRIHVIGYGGVEENILRYITDRSGGSFYHLDTTDDIRGVFSGIIHKTKAYYRISYKPCQEVGERTLFVQADIPEDEEGPLVSSYTYSQELKSYGVDESPRVLILFDYAKHSLKFASYDEKRFELIATQLKAQPNSKIILTGYTDSKGKQTTNKSLGWKRAKAVSAELQKLGVNNSSIELVSAGENSLVHDPDYPSEWRAAENRRVEFQIVTK